MRIIEFVAQALAAVSIMLTLGLPAGATEAVRRDAEIIGVASVIDDDTLEIHDRRIRLDGIDAPESAQLCLREGRKERCGQRSALFLADLIGHGTVRCVPHDVDRYGRDIATCWLGDVNLNEEWPQPVRRWPTGSIRSGTSWPRVSEGGRARDLVDPVRDAVELSPGALAKARGRH